MVNLTALQNLTSLSFDTTNLTDSQNIIPNMISNTDNITQGYFGLGIMIIVFLVLLYTTFRQDGDIRMDITRSLMLSSGFTSILGLVMIVTGFITSFVHLMWFLSIFIISIMILFNLKRKGF